MGGVHGFLHCGNDFFLFSPQVHGQGHVEHQIGVSAAGDHPEIVQVQPLVESVENVLQTLVIALGAGLAVWGVVNLMEGYGNDNPGAKSQGIKQLMAGGGVVLIGTTLIPLLSGLFG